MDDTGILCIMDDTGSNKNYWTWHGAEARRIKILCIMDDTGINKNHWILHGAEVSKILNRQEVNQRQVRQGNTENQAFLSHSIRKLQTDIKKLFSAYQDPDSNLEVCNVRVIRSPSQLKSGGWHASLTIQPSSQLLRKMYIVKRKGKNGMSIKFIDR